MEASVQIKKFHYKKEKQQNPYIGFTSFQHFRNEALYSDCVVGHSGIAGCETENYECYPVTEGVEELGRNQGFYPDTTVAYIRVFFGFRSFVGKKTRSRAAIVIRNGKGDSPYIKATVSGAIRRIASISRTVPKNLPIIFKFISLKYP